MPLGMGVVGTGTTFIEFSVPVCSHLLQAYFGRTVSITLMYAGTNSSFSLRASPILCSLPWQQSHTCSSMDTSIVTTFRGNSFGSGLRVGLFLIVTLL